MIYSIESLIEAPIKRKRIYCLLKSNTIDIIYNIPKEERDSIREKQKTTIELMMKVKSDRKELKQAKIRELTENLLKVNITNAKNENLKIALLSLLSSHFENNNEVLAAITSTIASSLLSTNYFCRAFSALRLINILALRQKNKEKPEFITKDEYKQNEAGFGEERMCRVNIDPTVFYKHGITEETKIFIDKTQFGWQSVPPYVKIYKGGVSFDKVTEVEKKTDSFGEIIFSEEFVNKLINQSILDHESKEEQQLMNEREEGRSLIEMIFASLGNAGKADMFSQVFSLLFHDPYSNNSKFFNSNQAAFYQSIFEFYGPSSMKLFAKVLEKKISEESKNSFLGLALEIVAGFMRSTKCFKAKLVEDLLDFCTKIICKIIQIAPLEVFS